MTPETLKSTCVMFRTELEHQGASMGIMSVFDSMCSYLGGESRDLNRALAALEEAKQQQQQQITLDAHERDFNDLHRVERELVEAQQTIAWQREALEFYAKKEHWELPHFGKGHSRITSDGGSKARELLEEGGQS